MLGVFGSVRPYADKNNSSSIGELKWERDDEIGRAVNYIRKNFRKNIAIADLVKVSGLNHRKLHRDLSNSLCRTHAIYYENTN